LEAHDVAAFLADLHTSRDRVITLLMLLGGLRAAEVRSLRLANVDMGLRRVRVRTEMTLRYASLAAPTIRVAYEEAMNKARNRLAPSRRSASPSSRVGSNGCAAVALHSSPWPRSSARISHPQDRPSGCLNPPGRGHDRGADRWATEPTRAADCAFGLFATPTTGTPPESCRADRPAQEGPSRSATPRFMQRYV